MSLEPFETAEAQGFPSVRQLSIFIENRIGQLLRLTRVLEQTDVHILALSVVNSMDCAIIRMIVDQPTEAASLFRDNGIAVSQTDLLVVGLPDGKRALLHILTALMAGEVNVLYTYPLLVRPHGMPALALQPDNLEMAIDVFRSHNFDVLDEADLLTAHD